MSKDSNEKVIRKCSRTIYLLVQYIPSKGKVFGESSLRSTVLISVLTTCHIKPTDNWTVKK
jgi:hypothetical protein